MIDNQKAQPARRSVFCSNPFIAAKSCGIAQGGNSAREDLKNDPHAPVRLGERACVSQYGLISGSRIIVFFTRGAGRGDVRHALRPALSEGRRRAVLRRGPQKGGANGLSGSITPSSRTITITSIGRGSGDRTNRITAAHRSICAAVIYLPLFCRMIPWYNAIWRMESASDPKNTQPFGALIRYINVRTTERDRRPERGFL